MLDDLRNTANQDFPEGDSDQAEEQIEIRFPRRSQRELFGMTAPQRFILALLLVMMIVVLSVLCLIATGKIWI